MCVYLTEKDTFFFSRAQRLKRLSAMRETWVPSLGWEDPLEKEMAIHSSILELLWWLNHKESAYNAGTLVQFLGQEDP